VRRGWRGDIKGPFNVTDREKVRLTPQFYEGLKGKIGLVDPTRRTSKKTEQERVMKGLEKQLASLNVEYDKTT
jgi:hypothetical protein